MAFDYYTIPSGRPDGTPPLEPQNGGYYYKYSYSWTSQAASTEIDLCDAELKFSTSKVNNAYIFLSCIGTTSTPPEFGIYAPQDQGGKWICYTREAGSSYVDPHETIFTPDPAFGNVPNHTYANSTKITMRIRLDGNDIIGTILRNGSIVCSHRISGNGASVGTGFSTNTFLLETSFVPNPPTNDPGNRDAYLKHVYLRNGKLYVASDYNSSSTQWVPDSGNDVTYYSLVCNSDYVSYNRFGTTDEEICIDYS